MTARMCDGFGPEVLRRHAEFSLETAAEVGRILEAPAVRNVGDGPAYHLKVLKLAFAAQQPLTNDVLLDGRAIILEERVQITHRDPLCMRYKGRREAGIA